MKNLKEYFNEINNYITKRLSCELSNADRFSIAQFKVKHQLFQFGKTDKKSIEDLVQLSELITKKTNSND
ncbi:hypothetical protein RBH94_15105 [Aestuariibaculum sp. YM273]|uniref:hypothetical protein n=1 Tax=Aestuariibaculum sp. YM273 TaxID=3070659 RepID=UPI0027DE1F14|nr:hypothetical protein [Aestuariibaculum sp. YM273]WMI65379.1 hypothetical protein RBH94_15105 [Aestuariibaculum sp. YM273]